jgi:hypothetical protein
MLPKETKPKSPVNLANTKELFRKLGELRARNVPWPECARLLRRDEKALEKLRIMHADLWDSQRQRAQQILAEECLVECIHVLRAALRQDDVKIQQASAKVLLALMGDAWPKTTPPAPQPEETFLVRMARHWETLDDTARAAQCAALFAAPATPAETSDPRPDGLCPPAFGDATGPL